MVVLLGYQVSPTRRRRPGLLRVSSAPMSLLVLSAMMTGAIATHAADAQQPVLTASQTQRHFQLVLAAMRQPPASGALIISSTLIPAARRAGFQPGDIITWLAHQRVESPANLALRLFQLRHQITPLPVIVARNDQILELQASLQSLHFSTLAVVAGEPAPLNPPLTAPHTFALHWNRVPPAFFSSQPAVRRSYYYRLFERHIAVGIVHMILTARAARRSVCWSVRAAAGCGIATRRIRMVLLTGNNRQTPPLVLQTISLDSFHQHMHMVRRGPALTAARPDAPSPSGIPLPLNAVPAPALAALAMALPRKKGVVLSAPELTVSPWHLRPGCVIETLGRRTAIAGGVKRRLWAVRVLRLDIPQMTFWLDRSGRILRIDLPHHRQLFLTANKRAAKGLLSLPKLPPSTSRD